MVSDNRKYLREIFQRGLVAVEEIDDEQAALVAEGIRAFLKSQRPIMMAGAELRAFIMDAFTNHGARLADAIRPQPGTFKPDARTVSRIVLRAPKRMPTQVSAETVADYDYRDGWNGYHDALMLMLDQMATEAGV